MSELKLEAGKYYTTRDGRKAFVECRLKNTFSSCSLPQPFVGLIEGRSSVDCWCEDGKWYEDHSNSSNDLVAEWREPVTKEVMVYLGLNGNVSFYSLDAIGAARVVLKEGVFAK